MILSLSNRNIQRGPHPMTMKAFIPSGEGWKASTTSERGCFSINYPKWSLGYETSGKRELISSYSKRVE
jgi:hypothetical protein